MLCEEHWQGALRTPNAVYGQAEALLSRLTISNVSLRWGQIGEQESAADAMSDLLVAFLTILSGIIVFVGRQLLVDPLR